ncbi:MAG TPA: hypothetical protein VNM70_01140, partial [Burkholderiales bacterium]|nr:hypothetical protein [Burkholderiales bacterium]
MELDEYQTPDPYAPREKASQLYAAAKRGAAAKAETGKLKAETGDPAPFPLSSFSSQLSAKGRGIGMALIIFAMIALASYQLSHLPAGPLVVPPKIAPVASPEARRATIAPAPVHPPAEVPQIAVYAAPGALLGTIEADRQITPIAHYGTDWIQADVEGSGRVWLRAADWPALAIVGVDLEPH